MVSFCRPRMQLELERKLFILWFVLAILSQGPSHPPEAALEAALLAEAVDTLWRLPSAGLALLFC